MTFSDFYIEGNAIDGILFSLTFLFMIVSFYRFYQIKKTHEINISFFWNHYPIWLITLEIINQIFFTWYFLHVLEIQEGVLGIIDGKKVIHNHGIIIKELTEKEYVQNLILDFRQSMGHNLIFFGGIVFLLFPIKTKTIANTA